LDQSNTHVGIGNLGLGGSSREFLKGALLFCFSGYLKMATVTISERAIRKLYRDNFLGEEDRLMG
jgi:hypothetical protein